MSEYGFVVCTQCDRVLLASFFSFSFPLSLPVNVYRTKHFLRDMIFLLLCVSLLRRTIGFCYICLSKYVDAYAEMIFRFFRSNSMVLLALDRLSMRACVCVPRKKNKQTSHTPNANLLRQRIASQDGRLQQQDVRHDTSQSSSGSLCFSCFVFFFSLHNQGGL